MNQTFPLFLEHFDESQFINKLTKDRLIHTALLSIFPQALNFDQCPSNSISLIQCQSIAVSTSVNSFLSATFQSCSPQESPEIPVGSKHINISPKPTQFSQAPANSVSPRKMKLLNKVNHQVVKLC